MAGADLHYFFCGIGGSGMSALATVMRSRGHAVSGSDRSFDQAQNDEMKRHLQAKGMTIFPQDGSGVSESVNVVVSSTAVEASIPDISAARDKNIPIIHRSELLRQIFEKGPRVAVGGTSGKTTVTGMIGHILREVGRNPTVINGGLMLNSTPDDGLGNAWSGNEDCCVIEADESDGTIELYSPDVAVLTTVSLDHQPMEELNRLFDGFLGRAGNGAVVSADCADAAALAARHPQAVLFGIDNDKARLNATNIMSSAEGISFEMAGLSMTEGRVQAVKLQVPGRHNVLNALAAIGACSILGVGRDEAAEALATYKGTHRRLEIVGRTANGITVIDDFAHNPEKIQASLQTLTEHYQRLIVYYQPHGFKPTKMLKNELVQAFSEGLRRTDILIMQEIFYAGGTASRDISSKELADAIINNGRMAIYAPDRDEGGAHLTDMPRPGDCIVIMGARDNTLATFARQILNELTDSLDPL